MKIYRLGLVFQSLEDQRAWVDENCPEQTYQGAKIIMIASSDCGGEIVIDEIWTV